MAVDRARVIRIDDELIPDGSLAAQAAQVRFGDGRMGVVEMFTTDQGRSIDFRGLPSHLADGDAMHIEIKEELPSAGRPAREVMARQSMMLFEFAIGARQTLWPGAIVQYFSDANDPTSRHYRPYRD